LQCKLITEDGKEIIGTMKKKGHCNTNDNKQKSRPPLHYLQLHEDCTEPKISSVSGECIVKFRINDVSQNHKNQGFHVVIQPNIAKLPHLCEVYECRSKKIIVKSKSPEKLNAQSSSKKRRSSRRSKKKVTYDEEEDEDDDGEEEGEEAMVGQNGYSQHNGHHTKKHSKSKRKRKKKRKHKKCGDSDGEYKPEHSENSDREQTEHIKLEGDIENNLRKRRKLNSSQYIKTNGPKTFDVPPTQHWFHHKHSKQTKSTQTAKDKSVGPEAEIQLFAQSCFEMLQFREWVLIGYQTQYIHRKKNKDKLQIVRCLLCDAEGTWDYNKTPRHKKGCDFVKLKRSFHQIQHQFANLSASPMQANEVRDYPMTTIISPTPKMSHLPPLPPQHHPQHNRLFPPPIPPPFYTHPFPPMFAPNPPYHILPNPPPLIQASSSNTTNDHNKTTKTVIKKEKPHKEKKKTKIKTQEIEKNTEHKNKEKSPLMFPFGGHQSPQMFPQNINPMQSPLFSMSNVPQTPQMFGQPLSGNNNPSNNNMFLPGPNPNAHNVGNHHSSLNNYHSFGHTASSLPMPLSIPMRSIISPNIHNNKEVKSSSALSSSSMSSSSEHKEKNTTSSKKENSRSPTPNPPISTITAMSGITQDPNLNPPDIEDNDIQMTSSKNNHNDNDNKLILDNMPSFHSSRASSACNTAAATMGSPTATLRSNPPQSKPKKNNVQMAVSVDSGISRLSQSASLSAVATAGGLTVNTPNNDQMIAAHAPPPLLPQYNSFESHILQQPQHQHSSNNSIETQIGSMPPLHPDSNTNSNKPSNNATDNKPLHQRRLMENAPTTLTIPSAVTSNSTPFHNMT